VAGRALDAVHRVAALARDHVLAMVLLERHEPRGFEVGILPRAPRVDRGEAIAALGGRERLAAAVLVLPAVAALREVDALARAEPRHRLGVAMREVRGLANLVGPARGRARESPIAAFVHPGARARIDAARVGDEVAVHHEHGALAELVAPGLAVGGCG